MKLRLVVLITLACAALLARTQEEKLADALMKANRRATHANAEAQKKGHELEKYCQTQRGHAGIRQDDGLWGCVAVQPLPPPNTTTNR